MNNDIIQLKKLRAEINAFFDRIIEQSCQNIVKTIPPKITKSQELFTADEICKKLHISKATFFRKVKCGEYPKGIYVSARSPRWRIEEIIERSKK